MTGRLLAALALALTSLVLLGTPAHACSCVQSSTAQQAARSTHVFVGTVTASGAQGRPGQAGSVTYDIDVSEVYKGDVPEVAQVRSSAADVSCGLGALPTGRPIAFFATADRSGSLVAGQCSGTVPVSEGLSQEMSSAMGDPAVLNRTGGPTGHAEPADPGAGAGSDGATLWPWLVALLLAAGGAATWTARRTT